MNSNTFADNMYGYAGNDTISGTGKFYGGSGNDILQGYGSDDTFDGGTGSDTITTGTGSDVIVIRTGDGGSTIADADVIKDFTDGSDTIGLDDGLQFSQLNINQGTGSNSSHTIVSVGSSSEYLLLIENFTSSNLTEADFTPIDFL